MFTDSIVFLGLIKKNQMHVVYIMVYKDPVY